MVAVAGNRRVTVELNGRLGNQLFQCAAAMAHAQRLGTTWGCVGTPASPAIGQFVVPSAQAEPYVEPSFGFRPLPERVAHLQGYFQSARYFTGLTTEDLDALLYVSDHALVVPQAMFRTPYAAWHIRRGDYTAKTDYHPVLPLSYYRDAMAAVGARMRTIICTDDPAWCAEHITEDAMIIGPTPSPLDALATLTILRFATVLVMANSSLSWWAGYTSPWAKIILAPSPWFGPKGPRDTADLYHRRFTRVAWDGPELILPGA